jgi:protein O-GlcNAc transferase
MNMQMPEVPAGRIQIDALIDAGLRCQQVGDYSAAVDWYQQALALESNNFDALQLLGLVRLQTGNDDAGIELLERSLAIEPRQLGTLNNLAGVLRSKGRMADAIAAFRQALALDPTHPAVLTNLGSALFESGDFREAAACFAHALERDDRNPDIYCWVGHLYRRLGRPVEAARQFRYALQLSPQLEKVLAPLGAALDEAGDSVGALEALRAAESRSRALSSRVHRAYTALRLADWRDWVSDAAAVSVTDLPPGGAGEPGKLMSLPATPELLCKAAGQLVAQNVLPFSGVLPVASRAADPARRIRVGYLSPDFRHHAVGNIIAEVFELREAARFEVFAYGWHTADGSRSRIMQACDHFEDVTDLSDRAVAEKLRADGIDIAIDLVGHTAYSRPLIFAAKPAPIQVSWLGYPGTTGASYMDYLVADAFTIPDGAEHDFSESVVRLPDTYLPYDRKRPVAQPRPRPEYGLPPDSIVLGCFGQIRKINPLTFDIWMEVLRETPRAVLWLASDHPSIVANLRREAEARGVSGQRILFAPPVPDPADHLARYRAMDLALDTFPYGSHSTAADAIWAGCPLLAVVGNTFVSRVSGSVVRAAGFPDLVAYDLLEYRELIRAFVGNPARIADTRARIETSRDHCALFDTPRFVRALEAAYLAMWMRYERGEPPAAFSVPA